MVLAETLGLTLDTVDITDSDRYRDHGYPWAEWDLLRREAPLYWYQRPGFEPFWAIARHADIRSVSAHRDKDVFEHPYKFDIRRDPNGHFAFGGYGEHFCLGANLARRDMRSIFHAMLPLLPQMALAADPEMVIGMLHVGGIKRQMVRHCPARA